MNKSIYSTSLVDILPENLRTNPDILAASKAIDPSFFEVFGLAGKVILLPNIDNQSEEIVDHLAWQFHVDFYDHSLPIETKRQLVKDSVYSHRKKGTPAAVEELISTVFGEGEVAEWYEYGGVPGYFKVITSNTAVTNELADQFIRALDSVKRKSAWLEKVEITQVESMNLYFSGIVHTGDKLTLRQVI